MCRILLLRHQQYWFRSTPKQVTARCCPGEIIFISSFHLISPQGRIEVCKPLQAKALILSHFGRLDDDLIVKTHQISTWPHQCISIMKSDSLFLCFIQIIIYSGGTKSVQLCVGADVSVISTFVCVLSDISLLFD